MMLKHIRRAVGRAIWWFLVPVHEERSRAADHREWQRVARRYGGLDLAPEWVRRRVEQTRAVR